MDMIKEVTAYDLTIFMEDYFANKGINIEFDYNGKSFVCCCPFHEEKTGSFFVTETDDGWLWYCHGACKIGGNIISLVKEYENVGFIEAMKIISDFTGINVEFKKPDPNYIEYINMMNNHRQRYIDELNGVIEDAIEENDDTRIDNMDYLMDDRLLYLKARGLLNKEIIDVFGIGLVPDDERKVGLKVRDVVGRISIPLDEMKFESENCVGFCYRTIEDYIDPTLWKEKQQDKKLKAPKYIMSFNSDSAMYGEDILVGSGKNGDRYKSRFDGIYSKKNYLWNYSRAYRHIRSTNEVIIVEGALDVISLYKTGIKNVVSTLTCDISDNIIDMLSKVTKNIVFWYDKDEAGQGDKLLEKVASFTEKGCHVYIYNQEFNGDPDEICRECDYDLRKMEKLIAKNKVDAYDFFIDKLLANGIINRIRNIKRDALEAAENILDSLPEKTKKRRLEEVIAQLKAV